jgi:signal transduction histidine kinase
LRTPLNAIIGFSELMHSGKVGSVAAEHKEFLGDILSSAKHLLQLINDILDLAKVQSGKMEFFPESVNPATQIDEACNVLHALAAEKRIVIEKQIDPGVGQVSLDPSKFKQVLYNYLSNALKFTPQGGRIVIRVMPEGSDQFRVEVEDNGTGIKPEDSVSLFAEFQQIATTAIHKGHGTGLGLALTKRIVEAQGGRVGLHSEWGKGSIFYAVLPRRALATRA